MIRLFLFLVSWNRIEYDIGSKIVFDKAYTRFSSQDEGQNQLLKGPPSGHHGPYLSESTTIPRLTVYH